MVWYGMVWYDMLCYAVGMPETTKSGADGFLFAATVRVYLVYLCMYVCKVCMYVCMYGEVIKMCIMRPDGD